jgi:hypothetical protein
MKNQTPHSITFYDFEDIYYDEKARKYILKDGATPRKSIPPTGEVLSCDFVDTGLYYIDGIEIIKRKFRVKNVPTEGNHIVSAMYATAFNQGDPIEDVRLFTVGDPVYRKNEDGTYTPVGCRCLIEV